MGPALVPELSVRDIGRSLEFYCDVLGFAVRYQRPEQGFAFLDLGSASLMLDQLGSGRAWVTGALDYPLGRGVNFQIHLEAIAPVLERLGMHKIALFQPPETKTYRVGQQAISQQQFCVQDPDGYLLRFCQSE